MFQTDQATAATVLPTPAAAATQGYFTNGNPGTGVPATILDADFLNMTMMELVNIVTAAGLTLSKTTYNQVLLAIKRLVQNQAVLTDTGAVNAYTAVNVPPLTAGTWTNGVTQQIVVAHTNTGASTYSPDALTAIPIYGLGLQPLQGNEMFAGGTAIMMKQTIAGVNSGNPIAVLLECSGGAQQIPAATQPLHALQAGQALGLYLGTQVITASGTYTPGTYTVAGRSVTATKARFRGTASGGAGGGASATGSGQASAGGGGSAGNPFEFLVTSGLASQTITVGAAGLGVSGANGGNGGDLVIGSYATIRGGKGGGLGGTLATFPGVSSNGVFNATSTFGSVTAILNTLGQVGGNGICFSTGATLNGDGGTSPYGSGGRTAAANGNGYGAGGMGTGNGQSAAAAAGNQGAPAIMFVDEYA
ncbi:hypothetical protein [Paraburkholderia lacunae]|uniref:Phage tail protein n=1 Tax=Paraburkholderia lacunae TaxID=2211104 RepID=A0A370N7N8_9BURK|nr:hypothetical protein [Paraburkholderia lacunae]RDK01616.1 hypothetical protein DLM46_17600 [Paraburkholderia lacunae]